MLQLLQLLKWILVFSFGGAVPFLVFFLNLGCLLFGPGQIGLSQWIFADEPDVGYFLIIVIGLLSNIFSMISVWLIYKLNYYNIFFQRIVRFLWYFLLPCIIFLLTLETLSKYNDWDISGLIILISLNMLAVGSLISAYRNNYYN